MLAPQSIFFRTTSAILLTLQPMVLLPQDVVQNCCGGSDAPPPLEIKRYSDLPDTFKEDWVPPAPVLSARDIILNKAAPASAPVLDLPQGKVLSQTDIAQAKVFSTPLRATQRKQAGETERKLFSSLLQSHVAARSFQDFQAAGRIKAFLAAHPDSGYATSLLLEAAEIEWRHGFFIDGLATLQQAWDQGKQFTDIDDRRLAEMALGRLLQRRSLMGQKDELRPLIEEAKTLPLGGYAADALIRAREVLWFLDHKAERNVFCGFTAANAICVPLGERPIFPDVHDDNEKAIFIKDGLSAFELKAHSHEGGGTLKVIKRTSGRTIIAPSVIHFKFNHYSALTETLEGKYRLTDEHLFYDSWVPPQALEQQMSGYFLVPATTALPAGYVDVGDEEAKTVFGRHCVHATDPEGPMPKCETCPPQDPGPMATYSFNAMNPGLFVTDTPVVHTPPYGPAVSFKVTYDQRSTVIGDLQVTGNLGPRWTHSYQEGVTLSGTGTPNTQVKWVQGDGSYFQYTYNTSTSSYAQKYKERPQLTYLTAGLGGPGYQLTFSDGSKRLFKQADAVTPTKYLLTQIIDRVGNTLTLQYDGSLRLTTLLDALGQATTISYTPDVGDNVSGDTTKIRKVTDPFSRFAKFKYTATGQLERIIDPIGIISQFSYGTGDFINRVTTPYGPTEFSHGEMPGINSETGRWIESKDAAGDRERVERNDLALPDNYVASPQAPSSVNVNGTSVPFLPKNDNLFYRNTFHWNRQQMKNWPGDYSKCLIYNWLTSTSDTITGVIGSIKQPLEGRVWFNYPNQTSSHAVGDVSEPSKVVRAVESTTGTTVWSMEQASFNDLGLPTNNVDAMGREVKYEYYPNNQDVQYMKVKNGASWETLLTISQYKTIAGQPAHLPEIMTDASGLQVQYSYNDKGQVTEKTVSKGGNTETTKYIYDANLDGTADAYGYLIRTEQTSPSNPLAFVTLQSLTYDSTKRVRTLTNSEGYTLTYDYDSLDRVTLVTHPDSTTEQVVFTDGAKQTLSLWASKDRAGRWTRMRYNQHRQLLMELDPLLRLTQYDWCKCGSLSKLIDPMGKVTTWKTDAQGRLVEKLLSDGNKYLYTYQPLSGRPATVAYPKDVLEATSTFTLRHHLDGRLQKKDYTNATLVDITLGAADFVNRSTSMTDQFGTTNYAYVPFSGTVNGGGKLATANGPWANDTLRYTYDWKGRLTKNEIVADDGVTVTRSEETTHDSLGRISQLVNNLGTFTSTFNAGNLTDLPDQVDLPGGFNTLYSRYAANAGANALRLQTIHHRQGTSTVQKHDYTYELAGNIKSWDRTNASANVTSWALRHDQANQLSELEESLDGTPQKKQAWHYDPAGNIDSTVNLPAVGSGTLQIRTIEGRNQLATLGGPGKTTVEGTTDEASQVKVNGSAATVTKLGPSGPWQFQKEVSMAAGSNAISVEATDANSNVKTNNYTVTVSAGADQELDYDANGNVVEQRDGAGTVTRTLEWDPENKLIATQSAATPAPGVKRSEFSYDGFGRRVQQVEREHNGTTWVTLSQWRYLWNGTGLAQKRETTSGTLATNYFSKGEQQLTTSLVYLRDHLGSANSWFRTSDGVLGEASYGAFGERTLVTAGPADVERGFTGHLRHTASDLLLAPFRAYNPELGRWMSEDPIQEAGGINLFAYVTNNVTAKIDPLGLVDVNMIPPSEKDLYDSANKAGNGIPDLITVAIHGNQDFVRDNNKKQISAEDLAKIIKQNPKFDGKRPVLLASCNTGGDNLGKNFGQKLADALGVTVYAPDNYVWWKPNGYTYLADKVEKDGKIGPGEPKGNYHPFRPTPLP
ncbi:RHS repeat-associated core domain-containing protein [Verrucomicrobium sp. BvORR034]|uniref:RHS repeat-associated core domain-containing protein n=1 Tax=Verrucomicrobium sp. BvORR034 TaxID=1396418 RepID=UPI0006793C59|nr:RHS repeat-associated core domain-containing protein [Verrucomicrobium sp. BvORR034]